MGKEGGAGSGKSKKKRKVKRNIFIVLETRRSLVRGKRFENGHVYVSVCIVLRTYRFATEGMRHMLLDW